MGGVSTGYLGSIVCVIFPEPLGVAWNGDLVLFAHGYVAAGDPLAIAWDQIDSGILVTVLNQGYAFATTSYSKNGLAVKQGVEDMANLVDFARSLREPAHIFIIGASEGGLVTALSIERRPDLYTGGIAACGPVGSFTGLVQYWGDFRAAFDQLFPGNPLAMDSTPIYIPPAVMENWDTAYVPALTGLMLANPATVAALVAETNLVVDPLDPASALSSIGQVLWYNVFATDDGRLSLRSNLTLEDLVPPLQKGNPYSNPELRTDYKGGIRADKLALKEIEDFYTTSGQVTRPLVLLHTTLDPVVPYWQSTEYVAKAGTNPLVQLMTVPRYGHCAFTAEEILLAFQAVVLMSNP
jgi:pimeloyl-ACP methyl ester carboxylesterase